jgi:DNA-directed RNA polymerase specialized sigma24 family protein
MPICTYLRGKGSSHDEAQDLTQGFFAYLLRREFLSNLQPEGGRFRNFLLVCLRRWMKDERKRVINLKQAAETSLEPWHELEISESCVVPGTMSPEEAFDRAWARELVARSMRALEERWRERAGLFEAIRLTVESPGSVERYAEIAARLGMTEGAVGKAVYDLRKQFAEQIRQEVRDTVASEDDVEGELRHLVQLMLA